MIICLALHLFIAGNCGFLYPGKATGTTRTVLPIPNSVYSNFVCVQTKVWPPELGIFNMRTDGSACNYAQGQFGCCNRVCTERLLWEKNPVQNQGIRPSSAACRSNTLQANSVMHKIFIDFGQSNPYP